MIDLQPEIRSLIINDATLSTLIADYLNSKAVFTRRPTPEDAQYPLVIISPIVTDLERDFILCGRRTLTYNIMIYGYNDTPENYRDVEEISLSISKLFHRIDRTTFPTSSDYSLIQSTASSPMPAPVDDENKVGRVVVLNLQIHLPI